MPRSRSPKAVGRASDADDAGFQAVVDAFAGDRQVTRGRMFGSTGLKVAGKVFAMLVKGQFVAKLPKARVDQLVATRTGRHFDPGHGRLMKEWVALTGDEERWVGLAREARHFVGGGTP